MQENLTSLGQCEADWQMKFNLAKCHSMRETRHQHHKQTLFDNSLHNQTLKKVQPSKHLGVTITDSMDWGQQVSKISSKATQTLDFPRRNLAFLSHFPIGILGQVWYLIVSIPDLCTLTYFAPWSTKEVAYKALARSKLEYAAPIWSHHSKLQINQSEKVQRTAARWTCRIWRNTSSIGEMLDELE